MTFTANSLRIYYNKSGNFNKAWSIDCGKGTPEILLTAVILDGVKGITCYSDVEDLPEDEPRGYLNLSTVEVVILRNMATVRTAPAAALGGSAMGYLFPESAPTKE